MHRKRFENIPHQHSHLGWRLNKSDTIKLQVYTHIEFEEFERKILRFTKKIENKMNNNIMQTPHSTLTTFFFHSKQFLAPGAYMPVILDHVPTYVYPKSVIIQPKGYIKYVIIVHTCSNLNASYWSKTLENIWFFLLFFFVLIFFFCCCWNA